METFLSSYRRDYNWPNPTPLVCVPQPPPLLTTPRGIYETGSSGACSGLDRWSDPKTLRYHCLAEREKQLNGELKEVMAAMGVTPSDSEDDTGLEQKVKLKSLYMTDYTQRGFEPPDYVDLMTSGDSSVTSPLLVAASGHKKSYRDPTSFRYTAMELSPLAAASPAALAAAPATLACYIAEFPGRSEYQDTVCKTAHATLNGSQQYSQLLVTARTQACGPRYY